MVTRRAVPVLVLATVALLVGGAIHGSNPPIARAGGTVPAVIDLSSLRRAGWPMPPDPVRTSPTAAPIPTRPKPALLVRIRQALPITSRPGGGPELGVMPARSLQYGFPTFAWVIKVSGNGNYGRVPIPYRGRAGTGWISLRGLRRSHSSITIRADLSKHLIKVERRGKVILRIRVAIGAPATPTPTGKYFVTDRVPFGAGSYYGTFAFGISGVQTHLPAGWSGGTQLAIHGTNNPSSIGRSASAGCLRVSEKSLAELKPLLQLGTPVIIQA